MSESLEQSDIREGYKEIQLGPKPVEVPSEWEIRKLDKLTNNSGNYGANVSAVEYDPEMPRYIRITDIGDDGFLKDDDRKSISRDDAEGYYLSAGDLLFARTGATAGKSYLCREDDPDAAYAGYLIRFELDESQVDIDFLAQYVQSKLYHDWVDRITRHGAQQNINASEYRSLDVLYPSLPEQRRIADILSTVDEQIQQTDEIIEKRAELLKGLKQDLLLGRNTADQQEIQMGPKSVQITSSWNVAKLGDVGRDGEKSFVDGDWVESDDMVEDGEYQLIQLGNIGIGEFKGNCDKFVSEGFFQEKNCTLVEQGDLLISRLADPVLRTIEVPKFEKKSITAVDIVVAKVDEKSWDKRYLRFLLNSKVMSDVGGALATGSTRQRISRKNMEGITIPKPPREAQTKIADVLEIAQTEVQDEKKYKQDLQGLKRGLMQDLLTGKVRVNTD